MVEEVYDEDFPPFNHAPKSSRFIIEDAEKDLIDLGSLNSVASSLAPSSPVAGPSRKGKGVDPGNWGDILGLDGFSEADLHAQRSALANYEEINRIQLKESAQVDYLSDFFPPRVSSLKDRAHKRSRCPRQKKVRIPEEAPQRVTKVDGPVAVPAPVKPPTRVVFQTVELPKTEVPAPAMTWTLDT
ncbi:hypothetical protein B0H13DRAFT_1874475 [Mycena leptocephala]|nr:hypothetical protein B0H13DRAFT_1874475 [Mycena leptocephala]